MWGFAIVALALAACGFRSNTNDRDGGTTGDDAAAIDGAIDAPVDAVPCYGTLESFCLATVPPAMHSLTTTTIDTSSNSPCMPEFATACVIAAQSITVEPGAVITATGPRPLVIIAQGDLTISGAIDVSSRRNQQTGAAANGTCNPPGAPQTGNGQTGPGHSAGGGGAGGSFADEGGNGGSGAGMPVRAGGSAANAISAITLRGGCAGQTGGVSGGGANNGGAGGPSGGAVYLIAGNTIVIGASGAVYASGAGGTNGTTTGGGGGGGGSGGLVALEAGTIMVNGIIAANGGGGGGAAGIANGTSGSDGANITNTGLIPWNQRAPGGGGSDSLTGDGGRGTDRPTSMGETGQNANDGGGGGGGGGSAGVVWYKGTLTGAQIAPIPTSG